MKNILIQYFGDGSTTSYDLPRALTSGYALQVTVDGVEVSFDYTDADTIALNAAPATDAIINLVETNDT